jgi:hypothetical protein
VLSLNLGNQLRQTLSPLGDIPLQSVDANENGIDKRARRFGRRIESRLWDFRHDAVPYARN